MNAITIMRNVLGASQLFHLPIHQVTQNPAQIKTPTAQTASVHSERKFASGALHNAGLLHLVNTVRMSSVWYEHKISHWKKILN